MGTPLDQISAMINQVAMASTGATESLGNRISLLEGFAQRGTQSAQLTEKLGEVVAALATKVGGLSQNVTGLLDTIQQIAEVAIHADTRAAQLAEIARDLHTRVSHLEDRAAAAPKAKASKAG